MEVRGNRGKVAEYPSVRVSQKAYSIIVPKPQGSEVSEALFPVADSRPDSMGHQRIMDR